MQPHESGRLTDSCVELDGEHLATLAPHGFVPPVGALVRIGGDPTIFEVTSRDGPTITLREWEGFGGREKQLA